MEVTGTREAFAGMIARRGVYRLLGVDRSTVAGWKRHLRQGRNISLDKMEEMLVRYGATVLREKAWEMPER